jgi:hypothetical protein
MLGQLSSSSFSNSVNDSFYLFKSILPPFFIFLVFKKKKFKNLLSMFLVFNGVHYKIIN